MYSDAFIPVYKKWGTDISKVIVIENWAPLEQISYKKGSFFDGKDLSLIYAGTLGLKHNPQLLVDLMQEMIKIGLDPTLRVISEGDGANYLRSNIPNDLPIEIVNFVPIAELNQQLVECNIALMLLEENASEFSVPSKTYSYLAAGKCIVALHLQAMRLQWRY